MNIIEINYDGCISIDYFTSEIERIFMQEQTNETHGYHCIIVIELCRKLIYFSQKTLITSCTDNKKQLFHEISPDIIVGPSFPFGLYTMLFLAMSRLAKGNCSSLSKQLQVKIEQ